MLAYILALVVALGSFTFYIAAFFVPEWHRRQDFFWSGLGLFYAVVLWFCAGRLTGAVLLGQVVSVALLGGLGWHTLSLRRDLTPETVRTPVTWEDLGRWIQSLQTWAKQSLPVEAVTDRLKVIWRGGGEALGKLRDRTPRTGETAAEVPPLKRSPAYEFETAAGDGQTVPSEFASVSQREQTRLTTRSDTPAPVSEAETAKSVESVEPSPDSAAEKPIAPDADAAPAGGDEVTPPSPVDEAALTAAESPQPPPAPGPPTVESEPPPTAAPPAPPPPPTDQPAPVTGSAPGQNPIAGAISRLGAMVRGRQKPQPQRDVIEIPPRAPSIPRSPDPETASATASQSSPAKSQPAKRRDAKSSRGVIEIPPRPPSIPRSADAQTASPGDSKPSSTKPQSAKRRDAKSSRGVIEIPPRPPSIPRSPRQPAASKAGQDSQDQPVTERSQNDDTNWSDEETNWDDGGNNRPPAPTTAPSTSSPEPAAPPSSATNWPESDPAPSASVPARNQPPPAAETDTNWPDDDDTNWPD